MATNQNNLINRLIKIEEDLYLGLHTLFSKIQAINVF